MMQPRYSRAIIASSTNWRASLRFGNTWNCRKGSLSSSARTGTISAITRIVESWSTQTTSATSRSSLFARKPNKKTTGRPVEAVA